MTAKIFHTVYEIWNPLTLECIYVGKGNTQRGRKQDHLREVFRFKEGKKVSNKFKSGVMAQIIDMGAEPVFVEIERYGTEEEALKEEMRLIAHYGRRILGTGSLTNFNDGGKGNFGHRMPEEAKRKIGEFSRGRKMPREAVERTRQKNTGKKRTPEQIEKLRLINLGRKHSEEEKKKRADSLRGKDWSEKRRNTHNEHDPKKGRPWSEDARKKMEEYYETHGKKMPKWTEERRQKYLETVSKKSMKDYDSLTKEQKRHRDDYLKRKNGIKTRKERWVKPYELLTEKQRNNRDRYYRSIKKKVNES